MPKVSVIIPVYNAEKYLKTTLDSVVNQTLNEIEIICVDDGSTDSSMEILSEAGKLDNRIIVVKQHNQGSGVARNHGLELAKGDYVAFMDADDFYPDERVLHDLYNAVINANLNIAGGSLIEILPDLRKRDEYAEGDARAFSKDGCLKYIDYQYDYYYQRFIYSRKFLMDNDIAFPLYRRHQDVGFFVQAMVKAEEFFALKRCTYCYRVDNRKILWKKKIAMDIVAAIKEIMDIARRNNLDKLYNRLLKRLIKQYAVIFLTSVGFDKLIVKLYMSLKNIEQEKFFR